MMHPRLGPTRAASWIGTLVVVAATVFALNRLPGRGGLYDELRWEFAQAPKSAAGIAPPQLLNRATAALWRVGAADANAPGRILGRLLLDRDVQVAESAKSILMAEASRQAPRGRVDAGLRAAFQAWFAQTTSDERVVAREFVLTMTLLTSPNAPAGELGDLPVTSEDQRWMLAGTLSRSVVTRGWADALVFTERGLANGVGWRLLLLDAVVRSSESLPAVGASTAPLAQQMRLPLSELAARLGDSDPTVRWAAGRILALGGDARGVPATCEWLPRARVPTAPFEADLARLFGADWHERYCGSAAASLPSQSAETQP